eukprot:gene2968-5193_t
MPGGTPSAGRKAVKSALQLHNTKAPSSGTKNPNIIKAPSPPTGRGRAGTGWTHTEGMKVDGPGWWVTFKAPKW